MSARGDVRAAEAAQVALLTGTGAAGVLGAALAHEGARLEQCTVHSVHHRPGAGVSVGYTAVVLEADGRRLTEYLCATTARLSRTNVPGLIPVLASDGVGPTIHVWRHPADPELPALVVACTPSLLSARIGAKVKATMVAYRPTRRAVVRVTWPDGSTAFAKVLRPPQAAALAQRHRMLTLSGVPAPQVLREDVDGLVMLSTGQGTSLSGLLAQGMEPTQATRVFNALAATLDALPADALPLPRHPAWSERARHYAHARCCPSTPAGPGRWPWGWRSCWRAATPGRWCLPTATSTRPTSSWTGRTCPASWTWTPWGRATAWTTTPASWGT